MDEVNDRARCGHPQALAHDRRGLGGDRRAAGRADGRRSAPRASPRCWSGRAALASERVWAIEDCRHVSGSFERFLIGRGERVVRVTTQADGRRRVARARGRGKSDSIDAIAVARAALREGLDALPAAQLDGPELDLRLLVDHRERLVRQRVALNNTLQWHLHDLWPELELPGSSLFYGNWAPARRPAPRARRADDARPHRPRRAAPHPRALPDDQGARGRDRRARRPDRAAAARRARLRAADRGQARRRDRRRRAASPPTPSSPAPPASRRSRSAPARPTATASTAAATARSTPPSTASPSPALRCHPETQDYIARKRAEGKSTKEAIRCLKRHLARRIWHLLQPPHPDQEHRHHHQSLDIGAAKAAARFGSPAVGVAAVPNPAPPASLQRSGERCRVGQSTK